MALNRAGRIGPLQALLVPVAGESYFLAVTNTAQDFDVEIGASETFVLTCDVDVYIRQSSGDEDASAADESMLVPAGMPVLIDGAQGDTLSIIRKASNGVSTLQRVDVLT